MLSSLVTSAGIAMAFNLVATASRRSTLRDATMTSALSRLASSAVARPIPEEPPTTTTFLPASITGFPQIGLGVEHLHRRPRQDQVGSYRIPIPGLLCPRPGSSQTPAPLGLISAAISTSI